MTYLAAKTTDHNKGTTNKLKKSIVTSVTETNGSTCVPSSQEEADTLISYHILSISTYAEVIIASPWTDVFVLMVQMYPSLPCYLFFHTGNRNLNRNIPVQPVYNKLGHSLASAILCFHGQTGSDMSGRFARRTNEVFMACDDDTLTEIFRPPRPIARRIQVTTSLNDSSAN